MTPDTPLRHVKFAHSSVYVEHFMTKREKRTSIRVRSNALLFPPRMPELPHLFLCLLARIAQLPRHILTDILFRTHQTFGQRVPLLRGQHLVKPTFRLTIWKAVLEI